MNYANIQQRTGPWPSVTAKLPRTTAFLFKKMPHRFCPASDPVSARAACGELLRITDVAAGTDDVAATDAGFVFVAKLAGGMDQRTA